MKFAPVKPAHADLQIPRTVSASLNVGEILTTINKTARLGGFVCLHGINPSCKEVFTQPTKLDHVLLYINFQNYFI